jgi:hypothetical protein
MRRTTLLLLAAFCASAETTDLKPAPIDVLLSHASEQTYGYYPYGWRGRDESGGIVYCVSTDYYRIDTEASRAQLTIGPVGEIEPDQSPAVMPKECVRVKFFLRPDQKKKYYAVSAAPKPDQVILQRVGRFVQHFEVHGMAFADESGKPIEGLEAWFEVYAWPDLAVVTVHVRQSKELPRMLLEIETDPAPNVNKQSTEVNLGSQARGKLFVRNRSGVFESIEESTRKSASQQDPRPEPYLPGSELVGSAIFSTRRLSADPIYDAPNSDLKMETEGITPYSQKLFGTVDPSRDMCTIPLGENGDINTNERVRLRIENPGNESATARLCFAKHGGGFGVTGMSPVLLDKDRNPLGIPIQISKNWHCNPPWFDGLTMLELPPHTYFEGEFNLAYARWGGVPAVSHSQLCLVGWGTNQLWNQMAIGSFGESICYDPDVNLNRSMIDDVRPLMVWGMGNKPQIKYSWTHNVGGGDFLVLVQNGKRQYLSNQRTRYDSYGPVIADVSFLGQSPDSAIKTDIRTLSWRTDDYVRGLYTLRYNVVKPVSFDRIAFFQLGADHYNHNLFTTISRGDVSGENETWQAEMGGLKYSRRSVKLNGDVPWIALTGSTKNPPPYIKEGDQGAWADRGMIVRNWKARLGGKKVGSPHYSIYGTNDGKVPSAVVELSPPDACTQLQPGDFVEAEVEMVIVPQKAEDYYGPNAGLIAALSEHPCDWRLIHREAHGNDLRVRVSEGKLIDTLPIVIAAKNAKTAKFSITGGVGYVPISITGLDRHAPFRLDDVTNGRHTIVQSGGTAEPSWQSQYDAVSKKWTLSFTLPLDADDDEHQKRTFELRIGVP